MTHFPLFCAASFSAHSIRLTVSTNTSPNHYFVFSLDSTFLFSSYQTVSVKPGRTKHPHIKCGHCWQLTFAKCFVSIFSSSVNIKSTRGEPIWKSPEIIEKHFHSPQELCGIKWMDTRTSMSPCCVIFFEKQKGTTAQWNPLSAQVRWCYCGCACHANRSIWISHSCLCR